jgi:hypothetical protein
MHRVVIAGLAILLLQPAAASAQIAPLPGEAWVSPRLRVTPFFGYAPPSSRTETRTLQTVTGEVSFAEFEVDLGAGFGGGANVEYRVASMFSVYGGGAFVRRGNTSEYSDLTALRRGEQGSSFIMTRAGVGFRLPESESQLQLRRLEASVFAGPTLVLELPRQDLVRTHADGMALFGAHLGLDAELPLGDGRLSLHGALEDNIVWWDDAELSTRAASVYGGTAAVTSGISHLFLLRVGLTLRVH